MDTAAESWGQGEYSSAFISLDELAIQENTDKSSKGHNYTPEYERHFESLRNEPIKLLEIGIDKGASLRMWSRYFSQGSIYGLDILDCKDDAHSMCITTIQGSQADSELLKSINGLYGEFSIIIDDGSHYNSHQMISFDTLFPLLKSGGIYTIEDLHCQYWKNTGRPQFDYGKLIGDLMAWGRRNPAEAAYFDYSFPDSNLGIKSIEFYKDIVFICKK